MKIAIIGCGVYSMAIAKRLSENKNNSIRVWSEDSNKVKEFKKDHKISNVFKEEVFNDNIKLYDNYCDTLKSVDIIFTMVSSKYKLNVLNDMKPYYKPNMAVIVGTKGINVESKEFFSKTIKKLLKTNNIAIMAGPSFAIDILNEELLALTIATKKRKIYKDIKEIFNDTRTSFDKTNDLTAIELSSVLKNIYAIGAGIFEGMGNSKTNAGIYLTKVLKELLHILYMFDKEEYNLMTYGCLGDTIMTCSNKESRNYTYGIKLTSKRKTDTQNFLKKNTVEGYDNLKVMYEMIKKKKIKANILYTIYDIVYNDAEIETLENELLK